jgi:TPR repeat protein/CHAT domain-containing protein
MVVCRTIALCLLGASLAQPALAADDAAQACAAAARYPTPDDPTGANFDMLDPDVAIPLCEAALAANAEDHASRTNLARALGKLDRYEDAIPHLRRAIDGGNLQAMRQMALILENGNGVAADKPAAFAMMQRAAEAGYVPAMDTLGLYLSNGMGVAEDDAAAIVWTRKAYEAGDVMAINNLAVAYEDGEGVAKDPAEAIRLYHVAASRGVTRAMRNLGNRYQEGEGVERDFAKAVTWYQQAIAANDAEAYTELGSALEDRDNPAKDLAAAVEAYRLGDAAGQADSTYNLGRMYRWGRGVARDYQEAYRLFAKAAEAGSTDGMLNLGSLMERGLGTPKNVPAAIALYRKGADLGDGRAMRYLGISYSEADGVERDYAQALAWFRKGAEADDTDSYAEIGQAYESGNGVAVDMAEAVRWYQKGHAAGSDRATNRLASMMATGTGGLAKDTVAAAKLFRQAAEAGNVAAMCFLADAYYWGRGVEQNHAESLRWLTRAADEGVAFYQLKLGKQYFLGDRTVTDFTRARTLFEKADESGEPMAGEWLVRATLADVTLAGRGQLARAQLEERAAKGMGWAIAALAYPGPAMSEMAASIDTEKWRKAAADVKDPAQLLEIAEAFKSGHLARQDFDKALKIAARAGAGDAFGAAEHQLGLLAELRLTRAALTRYELFTQTPEFKAATPQRQETFKRFFVRRMSGRWKADERSLDLLMQMADEGVAEAAKAIGDFYSADSNPRRDYARAEVWYKRAVDLGSSSALLSLGFMHGTARGRAEDPKTAVEYYQKAAAAGETTARANLGFMYLTGRGVEQDDAESVRWYTLASQDGDTNAKYWLALFRFAGRGGAADPAEAIRLLREAIDCAHEASRVIMARAYFEGAGVARDPEQGLRWMRLAAAYPDTHGQIGMARAAAFGWGMSPDFTLARSYLAEAARRGDTDAAAWLALCDPQATVACLQDAPDFRPEPLMRGPVAQPAIATPSFEAEEQRLRTELSVAIAENRSEFDITTAFGGLEQLYMLHGKTEALVPAAVNRIIQREAQLTRLYGQKDNYFALFDVSCAWSNASKNAALQGREEAAVLFAKVAVNKLQEARARIADLDDDIRECFIEAHRDRYRQLAETFLEMGRFEEAENVLSMLKDFEHASWTGGLEGRGRSLAMMPFTQSQALALAAIDKAAAANTAASMSRALGNSQADGERAFEAALAEAGRAVAALETAPSQVIATGANARPLRVADALSALARPGVAALQAVASPGRLHWLLTTPSSQRHIQLTIPLATLAGQVRAYRQAINDVDPEAPKLAKALYDAAFAEVDAALKAQGVTEVMLSLDDVLRYIPFAALHDGKGWLIERYAFTSFRDASDLGRARARRDWDVAGFGTTRAVAGFDELPETEKELAGIIAERGGLLPGTITLDDAFDAPALGAAVAGNAAVIHIASHFVLDSRKGADSFLLLGTGGQLPLSAFGRSGTLRFSNADFLALSACETGLAAPDAKGVEIESMAEIAQNAGAPAVLASLWEVADQSTSRLMVSFYRHRSDSASASKAGALRAAQLDLIAEGKARLASFTGDPEQAPADFAHPFFWAPFVLLGDAT